MESQAKTPPKPATPHPPRRGLRRAFLSVILVALVVVLMLWLFGAFHAKVGTQPAAAPRQCKRAPVIRVYAACP